MLLKRIIAWCFLSLALAMLGPEVILALDTGRYYPLSLMTFWAHFGHTSLDMVRIVGNNPIFFWVWDPVLVTLLKIPGWGVPFVISIYYFVTSRQTTRRPLLQ